MTAMLQISGPLTFETAASQIAGLVMPPSGGKLQIDFSGVTAVDSTAVALLLDWSRKARSAQVAVEFVALPDGLRQLIAVYGVEDILSQAG